MNVLTLKFFDDGLILYEYQPEGKGDKGLISYDKIKKTTEITKSASEDKDNYYARMAKSKVAMIVNDKSLPLQCVQAWY